MAAFHVGLVAVTLAGCGDPTPLTEIFLVIDTDLSIPVELDAVQIEILRPPDAPLGPFVTFVDPAKRFHVDPPLTLGIRGRSDPMRELEVVTRGIRRERVVLEQRARAAFVTGDVRVLCMRLDRGCLGVTCPTGQTCRLGPCVADVVDRSSLGAYALPIDCPGGSVASDAGAGDGGVSVDASTADAAALDAGDGGWS